MTTTESTSLCPDWCDGGHENDYADEYRDQTEPDDILTHHGQFLMKRYPA